jgi:hypothetical protein
MVTLPAHTSHAFHPLNVTCFKPFKNAFKKERDCVMAKQKYLEPNKIELVEWVHKAL